MKVWLISSSYPRTPDEAVNAGVLARDLALSFRDMGHEVRVISPAKPGGITPDDGLDLTEIRWLNPTLNMADLKPRRPKDFLSIASLIISSWWSVRSIRRSDPPDLIVALWAIPSGFLARWGATGASQSAVWLLGSDVWNASTYPFGERLLAGSLGGATEIYADGMDLVEETRRLTGMVPRFLPSVRRLPEVERRSSGHGRLLFIGRYHHNKGPDILLGAFAEILAVIPDMTLTMFGSGPLADDLRDRAAQPDLKGHVSIAGPIGAREVVDAMASHQLLVIPSRIDSVPLILGDAAQVGIPVVATDVGGLGDAVSSYGLGTVCPTASKSDISAGIQNALRAGRATTVPNTYPKPGEAAVRILNDCFGTAL